MSAPADVDPKLARLGRFARRLDSPANVMMTVGEWRIVGGNVLALLDSGLCEADPMARAAFEKLSELAMAIPYEVES